MKCEFMKKTSFTLKLKKEDTIAFAYLAAERGITSEQLLESFVRDIVSSFSSDEISDGQSSLAEWFNSCWFSQDNDGYFSFLQYVLLNKQYENIIGLLNNTKLYSEKKSKADFKISFKDVVILFNEYTAKNPAHKSFDEEINDIKKFSAYIKNI